MIRAPHPLNELRAEIFHRFRDRDDLATHGSKTPDERATYWSGYARSIAGLPTELRQNGLLATLALRGSKYRSSSTAAMHVFEDLKWADDRESSLAETWIEEIYAISDPADLFTRQKWLMDAAQAIKEIANLRAASAAFEASAARGAPGDEDAEEEAEDALNGTGEAGDETG